MGQTMDFRDSGPMPNDLEKYRGYLKIIADLQLNPRLKSKVDDSDIVQETLLRASRDRHDFRGSTEMELRGWLRRILTHTVINEAKYHRRQKRDHRLELSLDESFHRSAALLMQDLVDDHSTPSRRAMRREQAEQLADGLATLLDAERTAVILKHVHGWKVADIAESIGRTPEAVAGLLRRGVRKLRDAMTDSSV